MVTQFRAKDLPKKKHVHGFSVVEMLVAVAIFSIVIVTVVGAFVSLVVESRKARTQRVVIDNLHASIESMSREIRDGSNYVITAGGNQIKFEPRDGDDNPNSGDEVVYVLSSNQVLRSTQGGAAGTFVPFTGEEAFIETLKFTRLSEFSGGSGDQERILITMEGASGADERTKSTFSLQTTAAQHPEEFATTTIVVVTPDVMGALAQGAAATPGGGGTPVGDRGGLVADVGVPSGGGTVSSHNTSDSVATGGGGGSAPSSGQSNQASGIPICGLTATYICDMEAQKTNATSLYAGKFAFGSGYHDERGPNTRSYPNCTNVPAGTYDVVAVTFDDSHPANPDNQPREQATFALKTSGGTVHKTTGASLDISNDKQVRVSNLGSITTTQTIRTVEARHIQGVDINYHSPESFIPVCLGFYATGGGGGGGGGGGASCPAGQEFCPGSTSKCKPSGATCCSGNLRYCLPSEGTCTGSGASAQCQSAGGYVCTSGFTQYSGRCVPNGADHCGGGWYCQPGKVCTGGSGSSALCQPAGGGGSACAYGYTEYSGYCVPNGSAHCGGGYYCAAGTCQGTGASATCQVVAGGSETVEVRQGVEAKEF